MATFVRRILSLVTVRIIHYKTTGEALMVLQRESIQQRHHRFTIAGGRRFDARRINRPLVFDDDTSHLAGCPEELYLLALNECRVLSRLFKKRSDGTNRKTHEDRLVCDLLDGGLLEDLAAEPAHETDHPVPRGSSSSRVVAEPELNLAWNDLVVMTYALAPVVEYARLDQTILHTPWPDVPQLGKDITPLPHAMG